MLNPIKQSLVLLNCSVGLVGDLVNRSASMAGVSERQRRDGVGMEAQKKKKEREEKEIGHSHGGNSLATEIGHGASSDQGRVEVLEVHLWIGRLVRVIEFWVIIKKVVVEIRQGRGWAQGQDIGRWLRCVDHVIKKCGCLCRKSCC